MKSRYYVLTWDTNKQAFTPQQGVRCGPYSQWGLKRALQKLKMDHGYECHRHDAAVLVERRDR